MKKAQGLSMSTIVIAAIALIVMIILILIFSGGLGRFRKGESSCITRGGFCVEGTGDADANGMDDACETKPYVRQYTEAPECPTETQVCCLKEPGS